MKTLLSVFCILASISSIALADEEFQPTPYHLLKENMTIYAEPRSDSAVMKELEPGAEITRGRFLELKEIDKVIWRWYEVIFEQDGERRQGYAWTPLDFENDRLRYGDTRFRHELRRDDERNARTVTVYAERGGQAASKSVEVAAPTFTSISALTGPELNHVLLVVELYAGAEACGLPDERHYFAWTGSELVTLPRAINMGGAGVKYLIANK